MKVRKLMPLLAAALIAVLTLALGAGTGAAKTDVTAAPAPFKVALVTDIGGLDDRSFNFLANKGLVQAKTELKVQGRVFISKSNADYVPNLSAAARGWLQPRHLGRVPDGRRDTRPWPSASRRRSSRSSTTRAFPLS